VLVTADGCQRFLIASNGSVLNLSARSYIRGQMKAESWRHRLHGTDRLAIQLLRGPYCSIRAIYENEE